MAIVNPPAKPWRRRWTRKEFYKLSELGFFREQRVELLDGVIYQMTPQKNEHGISHDGTRDALLQIFGAGFWVRTQMSLDLSPYSVPDPDIAVVVGDRRSYAGRPVPRTALLVVEISDTTLGYDRHRKASVYARAGIADYWIVNVKARQLEVRRQPGPGLSVKYNFGYAPPVVLQAGAVVAPLAAPQAQIAVADLLP